MSALSEERAYARAIERRFVALRDGGFFLSSSDFTLLLDWCARGVPAALVVEVVERLFARAAPGGEASKIRSLAYCRPAVEAAWKERRTAMLGGDRGAGERSTFTPSEVREHLSRCALGVRNAAARAVPASGESWLDIALRLETLGAAASADGDWQPVEEELATLERRLVALLDRDCPREQRDAIEREAEEALAALTVRMSERARKSTLRRATAKALLARSGIPRLSLFAIARLPRTV